MTINHLDINKLINQLPPFSSTCSQLINMFNENEIDFEIVEEVIEKDMALSARILSIANSPFYGLERQIKSIRHACVVLGFNTLKQVAVMACFMEPFANQQPEGIDKNVFWYHSYVTGHTAKQLANASNIKINSDEIYMSGLLHDIGKLMLEQFAREEYKAVLEYHEVMSCMLYEAEKAILNVDHAQVGGELVRQWNISENIALAILYHHTPNDPCAPNHSAVVSVADTIVRGLDIGDGVDTIIPENTKMVIKSLGIDETIVKAAGQVIHQRISSGNLQPIF